MLVLVDSKGLFFVRVGLTRPDLLDYPMRFIDCVAIPASNRVNSTQTQSKRVMAYRLEY